MTADFLGGVPTQAPYQVDLVRLFKLRLVVARHGEMDLAKWWNSNGMLGRRGAVVVERGFPRTHFFAQARAVFAIARSRSTELYDPPRSITLWNLPAELEDQFEDAWQRWLDQYEAWSPFFESLKSLPGTDLLMELEDFELIGLDVADRVRALRPSSEGRSIEVPGPAAPADDVITLLAAAFARSDQGTPLIPYVRLGVSE